MNAEDWLSEAEEKLQDARASAEAERFAAACFWSPQAAELSLKAVYIHAESEAPSKVHDLVKLANEAASPQRVQDAGARLNPAYTEARYLGVSDTMPSNAFTQDNAETFIRSAETVL